MLSRREREKTEHHWVYITEVESKRVAYSAEEPEPTTSEKVSSWIQKNPTSQKPRTPPYIFLFAEEDPSPEPTR
ncbi:hypothetical protein NPIL_451341, partial [Nephila pilipes]